MTKWQKIILLVVGIASTPGLVAASQLTYTPVNPDFGGSPFNGPPLLNEANAQNQYTAKQPAGQSTDQLLQQEATSTLVASATNAAFSQAQGGGTGTVVIDGVTINFHPDATVHTIEDITITEPNGSIITLQTGITR